MCLTGFSLAYGMHKSDSGIDLQTASKYELPSSCVGRFDVLFGLAAILAVFFVLRLKTSMDNAELAFLIVLGNAITIGGIEMFRAPWRRMPPSAEPYARVACRAGVKFAGFLVCLGAIIFLYWVFPEYRRPFYRPFFKMLHLLLPWFVPISAIYFLVAEWRIPEKEDGSWHARLDVLGWWRKIDFNTLRHHVLGWLVKAYFLPLMFCGLTSHLSHIRLVSLNLLHLPFIRIYSLLFTSLAVVEMSFVTAGYFFSCRLFNSQVRSVENTLFGWFICLICYRPFSAAKSHYLNYRSGGKWDVWLAGHEYLAILWGSAIILLVVVYTWSTVSFGVRFSNLTNRGIITKGAFRFCKHPAYVAKNIWWWMAAVPFAATTWSEASRLCLLACCVNTIYVLRAFTEERLLSQDPTYVEYGLWMDRHGIFRWVGQIFPWFKYEYRLKRWLKRGDVKILPRSYFQ